MVDTFSLNVSSHSDTDLPLWVASRLLHCNMGTSAIWELIPITQKSDVLMGESFGRTRPKAALHQALINPVRTNRNGVVVCFWLLFW